MIAIVDYGAGNLRSVQKAFEKLGYAAVITGEPRELKSAESIVLPGVGAFRSGMRRLEENGLIPVLKGEIAAGKPFLGICLGMQMLLSVSYENGETPGLNIISGEVRRFSDGLKVPHMGWNSLEFSEDPLFSGVGKGADAYFVHSYYCLPEREYVLAETEYGCRFASAVRRGNVYGCQFHPEKSGGVGLTILNNFARTKVKA